MKCHIVTDLLPLYAEHLTSEETTAAISAHLAKCASCAAQFALLKEQGSPVIAAPEDISPLKAVRKRGKRRVLLAAALAALAALLFHFLFYIFCGRGFQLRSDQIELEISTYWDLWNEENPRPGGNKLRRFYDSAAEAEAVQAAEGGTIYEQISITICGNCFSMRAELPNAMMTVQNDVPSQYQPSVTDASLYAVYLPPLDTTIRNKSQWSKVGLHAAVAEGSTIMFRCRDGNFAYDITALAALAHASSDGTAHITVGERMTVPAQEAALA